MTRTRAPWIGLTGCLLLVAAAVLVPRFTGWEVWSRAARSASPRAVPPLHGLWEPKLIGPGTVPALLVAVLGWRYGAAVAERLSWARLLALAYLAGLAWLLALALVDGPDGISRVLGNPFEYLRVAREVDDVPALLRGYLDRVPEDAPRAWPTHVAGHPPVTLLLFVGLVRVGLGGDLAAGLVVTALAASLAPAVLTTLRTLGAEDVARRGAPFLVLTPAAVFLAVSADAVIAVVGAWGLAALAVAATRRGRSGFAWSVLAGLLLGTSVLMSYGMPLLGLLCLAVLAAARSWWPLPVAAVAALVPVLTLAGLGFAWWEAYPVLHDRYWDGVAARRPASYWMWGNPAALALSAGPLLGAGLAHVGRGWRHLDRAAVLLVAGAAAAVLAADLSRMSKAEVERIWLPFIPWLTISCALLPERCRRWGLALQLVAALLLQHLLYTSW